MYPGAVLVADNNPLCRGGVVALLRGAFPQITSEEAGDMGGLVASLSARPTDLAAIDVGLPGLKGALGLRFLRNRFPGCRLIALTWADEQRWALESLGAGVHGCVPKSLPAVEMLQAFQTVISGQIYVSPRISETTRVARGGAQGASSLTDRQTEVIRLLAAGQSNKQIARTLNIAEGTVKVHVMAAFRLLGVHNRVSAAAAISDIGHEVRPQPFLPGLAESHIAQAQSLTI